MLEALMPNNDEFYFAIVYEDRQDKKGEQIQYELLTETRRSYGQVINNLISEQGRKVIKSHDYEFKTGNIVVDEDGVKWYVQEAVQFKENINPQANLIMRINPAEAYAVSLVEIENPEEMQ